MMGEFIRQEGFKTNTIIPGQLLPCGEPGSQRSRRCQMLKLTVLSILPGLILIVRNAVNLAESSEVSQTISLFLGLALGADCPFTNNLLYFCFRINNYRIFFSLTELHFALLMYNTFHTFDLNDCMYTYKH